MTKEVKMVPNAEPKKEEISYEQLMQIAQEQAKQLSEMAKVLNEVNINRGGLLVELLKTSALDADETTKVKEAIFKSLKIE